MARRPFPASDSFPGPSIFLGGPADRRGHRVAIVFGLFASLFGLPARPAFAADGVLEINQACAVNSGCFAGDAPGYPVTVDGSAGSSYRLSSDLVVPNENTVGIRVSAENVSVDLAGFEIRGPVVCGGAPPACVPSSGSGIGVAVSSPTLPGLVVFNGSVRGMGSVGVQIGTHGEVRNVRARSNASTGIIANPNSRVTGCIVADNGGDGILASAPAAISDNAVRNNGISGINIIGTGAALVARNVASSNDLSGIRSIQTGMGASFVENTTNANGGDGIFSFPGSTFTGNTSFANAGAGISATGPSVIADNTVRNNDGSGISAGSGSLVRGNAAFGNDGFGLSLGSGSGYRENVIMSNGGGTVSGASAVNLGNNACNGTTACP